VITEQSDADLDNEQGRRSAESAVKNAPIYDVECEDLQADRESLATTIQDDRHEAASSGPTDETDEQTAVLALQKHLFSYWTAATMEISKNDRREGHHRTATLNANGINRRKMQVLLLFIKEMKIDILSLQDTRLDENESKLYSTRISRFFGRTDIQVRIA